MKLDAIVPGRIWVTSFPVRCGWTTLQTRMTVIRLPERRLWLHCPVPIDRELEDEIRALGEVAFVVASSTAHDLYVSRAMRIWPHAKTFACPGLPGRRPDMTFDAVLATEAEPEWEETLDQVRFGGNHVVREVVFYHRESRTLIVSDLLMNLRGRSTEIGTVVQGVYRLFGLWGHPVPSPDYLLFTWDKRSAEQALSRVLRWDFQRVIVGHGELMEGPGVKAEVERAWLPLTRRWD